MEFRIDVSRFGADCYVLAVGGELDLYTVEPLREHLAAVFEEGGRWLLVDLTGVTFIDSTSLSTLVVAAKTLVARGGQLVLVVDDVRVRRTFEISGLDTFFLIESSLPEAVEELVGQRR
jgi:anti-sigma B factor antagonist